MRHPRHGKPERHERRQANTVNVPTVGRTNERGKSFSEYRLYNRGNYTLEHSSEAVHVVMVAIEHANDPTSMPLTRLFDRIPYSLIALIARVATFSAFFRSGTQKPSDWSDMLQLFESEYRAPLLPPGFAASAALSCSVMVLLGLATRISVLLLLGLVAVMQALVAPNTWPEHIQWLAVMLILLARGPGRLSIDSVIVEHRRPPGDVMNVPARLHPMQAQAVIAVMIVTDHPIMREGLRLLVQQEPDMSVVCEASDLPQTMRDFRACNPDVVLIDLQLPGGAGLHAMYAIRGICPAARLVILATYPTEINASPRVQEGPTLVVSKMAATVEVILAIRDVLNR